MAGMTIRLLLVLATSVCAFPSSVLAEDAIAKSKAKSRPPVVVTDAARILHAECLVFDGHNDLPWSIKNKAGSSFDAADIAGPQERFHTDIPRLKEGGLGALFWSAYVPADTAKEGIAAHQVLEQIDLIYRMIRRYPETFELARTADDVVRIRKSGKIASLIGLEGGHAIENSLGLLRMFANLGVRYMTLAHSETLDWVDSATDEARNDGLTSFGEDVVRTMNELGMLVDISHISADAMRGVLRVTGAPVIASHSSAFAIAPHPRNVPDDVLRQIKSNRGVVMVNFYSAYIMPESAKARANMFEIERALERRYPDREEFNKAWDEWHEEHPIVPGTVHDLIDHIDHIVKIAGVDCVGLGSDFDGVPMTPQQLEDVACFPVITQALLDRGYSTRDIRKILGGNTLRVLREAEQISEKLQLARKTK
jgi:membrane dipeptidase